MIIIQFRWEWIFSNKKGILRGEFSEHKMRVINLGFLTFLIIPKSSSSLYWSAVTNLARDKDWFIKNNEAVNEAVKIAAETAKKSMEEMYAEENARIRKENEDLQKKSINHFNTVAGLKSTIRTFGET